MDAHKATLFPNLILLAKSRGLFLVAGLLETGDGIPERCCRCCIASYQTSSTRQASGLCTPRVAAFPLIKAMKRFQEEILANSKMKK